MKNNNLNLEEIKNNKLVNDYLKNKNLLNANIKAYKGVVYEAGTPDYHKTFVFDVVYRDENNLIKRQDVQFERTSEFTNALLGFYQDIKHRKFTLMPTDCFRGLPVVLVEITNDSDEKDYIIIERKNLIIHASNKPQVEEQEELGDIEYSVVDEIYYSPKNTEQDADSLDYYVGLIVKSKDIEEWKYVNVNCRKSDLADLIEYTTNSTVWDEYEEGDEETFHLADRGDRFEEINLKAVFGTEYPLEFIEFKDSNFKFFTILEGKKETVENGNTVIRYIKRYEFDEFDGRGW